MIAPLENSHSNSEPKAETSLNIERTLQICEGTLAYAQHATHLQDHVRGICPITSPVSGSIAFSTERNVRDILQKVDALSLAALIVSSEAVLPEEAPKTPVIRSVNPTHSIVLLVPHVYSAPTLASGIDSSALIHPTAILAENVAIGPFTFIGENSRISDNVVIHSHVTIASNCTIGKGAFIHAGVSISDHTTIGPFCVLQNGAVIGSQDSSQSTFPTTLAPSVDVGANTDIARGRERETNIGMGSKIDNLVSVGADTTCGAHSILCGQVAVGESSNLGSQVVLGGAVQVSQGCRVADGVRVAGAGIIRNDLISKGDYGGDGPFPKRQWARNMNLLRKLPKSVSR
jgi:UDP-3-O-[3-hydroxymyristoyl] glucosamine N-acyltransferase